MFSLKGNLNYKVEGSGETLVFIHGLSDSLLYWEVLAAGLKNDYQIVRFDLPGHGESELGSEEMTIDSYVNDLAALLDGLDINDVNLIGFSLGGAIALDFALKYPDKVDSLVIMSSFYKVDEHLEGVFNQLKNALSISFEEFYDLILPMVLCPNVIDDNHEELEMLKEITSKAANVEAYIKAIDAGMDFNVEKDLLRINVPTLVLAGKYDDITLLDSQEELQRRIKNSKLIVFDDVKHNLLIGKNNDEILDILKKFYKK